MATDPTRLWPEIAADALDECNELREQIQTLTAEREILMKCARLFLDADYNNLVTPERAVAIKDRVRLMLHEEKLK